MKIGVVWKRKRNIGLHERFLGISLPDDSEEECLSHCNGIKQAGHYAEVIDWDAPDLIDRLKNSRYDLVFNASYDEICLLEALGIPYSGSGLDLVSLDKVKRKIIVAHSYIPTPPFQVISRHDSDFSLKIPSPVIVKPASGRSSCGITDASVAGDSGAVYRLARKINDALDQDALVETFISGIEVTVGIWGNEHPEVIALLEIECVSSMLNTFENKKDREIFHCPPMNIGRPQQERISDMALKAYKALNARDYARIDMIVAEDGTPYFIELNTFPGLHMKTGETANLYSSYIGTMAEAIGMNMGDLYGRIIDTASDRLSQKSGICDILS